LAAILTSVRNQLTGYGVFSGQSEFWLMGLFLFALGCAGPERSQSTLSSLNRIDPGRLRPFAHRLSRDAGKYGDFRHGGVAGSQEF
jgi:hypothetical protein